MARVSRSSAYRRRRRRTRGIPRFAYRVERRPTSALVRRARRRAYQTLAFRLYKNPLARNMTYTNLTYNTVIQLNPNPSAISGNNYWVFSANSCFDPDVTSTGHQPMFYDNYTSVYARYQVVYSTIQVTVINHFVNTDTGTGAGNTQTTTPNYAYKLYIVNDRSSSDRPATMNSAIEQSTPNIKWRFVAPTLTGKLPKLKSSCSPHKLLCLDRKDDTLTSAWDASPGSQAYYHVGITSADDNTDPPNVYLNVKLKYYVKFFDRTQIQAQN